MIEDASITYAPSLTVLREMTKRRVNQTATRTPATLLALGNPVLGQETVKRAKLTLRDGNLDPLPEAGEEVKALAGCMVRHTAKFMLALRRVRIA